MFEIYGQARGDPGPGPWRRLALFASQALLAPLPVVAAAAFTADRLESRLGSNYDLPPGYSDAGVLYLASIIFGCLLGSVAGRENPRLAGTGRLVWLPPFLFFAASVAEYLTGAVSYEHWFPGYLYASGGNEGLGVFLTRPAPALAGYSLGMCFAAHPPRPRHAGGVTSADRLGKEHRRRTAAG
ncbi:MAG: hypothetical protein JSU00_00940 [Acidobacteria bacterium]|nr:hypothetical protein [Acidobacteriota bacterium]